MVGVEIFYGTRNWGKDKNIWMQGKYNYFSSFIFFSSLSRKLHVVEIPIYYSIVRWNRVDKEKWGKRISWVREKKNKYFNEKIIKTFLKWKFFLCKFWVDLVMYCIHETSKSPTKIHEIRHAGDEMFEAFLFISCCWFYF